MHRSEFIAGTATVKLPLTLLQKSKSRNIDLVDDEPEIVKIMLLYLYTFDYEVKTSRNSDTAMIIHACVYGLAHKYDIEGLQILA